MLPELPGRTVADLVEAYYRTHKTHNHINKIDTHQQTRNVRERGGERGREGERWGDQQTRNVREKGGAPPWPCPGRVHHMSETCPRHVRDMSETCPRHVPQVREGMCCTVGCLLHHNHGGLHLFEQPVGPRVRRQKVIQDAVFS